MTWKLYLDDETDPEKGRNTPDGFIRAYSTLQALDLIVDLGMPEFMDLDFDLGPCKYGDEIDTTEKFLKAIHFMYFDRPPPAYHLHTANVVGKAWMESYLESWKKSLER